MRERDPRPAGPAFVRAEPVGRRPSRAADRTVEAPPHDAVPSLTMVLSRLDPRLATVVRIVALVLISWSVLHSRHHLSGGGRGLVIAVCFVACVIAWLVWTIRPDERRVTPDVYVLAVA